MGLKVVIAGGGTGGHLFPGIALAKALKGHDMHMEITFVGTKKGIESKVLPKEGFYRLFKKLGVRQEVLEEIKRLEPLNKIKIFFNLFQNFTKHVLETLYSANGMSNNLFCDLLS